MFMLCNIARYYVEELLALRPTPQAGEPPLVAVHNCLFYIFQPILIGDCSSTHNLRICHAVVKGTHL
jgi:hypothetical protein